MDGQAWRWRVSGIGMVIVGVGGALAVFVLWGSPALLLSGLFGLIAFAGGFMLTRRQRLYAITLSVAGVLALLFGLSSHLNREGETLTLLFGLLAVVTLIRGVQAYRAFG